MRYFADYQRGVLLLDGGLAEQPARYLEVMAMISATHAQLEATYLDLKAKQSPEEGSS